MSSGHDEPVRLRAALPCWHESLASARTDLLIAISLEGAFIATKHPVPAGTPLYLEVTLPASQGRAEIDAVSVAGNGHDELGFHVRFLSLDDKTRTWIKRALDEELAARAPKPAPTPAPMPPAPMSPAPMSPAPFASLPITSPGLDETQRFVRAEREPARADTRPFLPGDPEPAPQRPFVDAPQDDTAPFVPAEPPPPDPKERTNSWSPPPALVQRADETRPWAREDLKQSAPRLPTPLATPQSPAIPSTPKAPMPRITSLDVPGGAPLPAIEDTQRWPTARVRVAHAPLEMPVADVPFSPPDIDDDAPTEAGGLDALFPEAAEARYPEPPLPKGLEAPPSLSFEPGPKTPAPEPESKSSAAASPFGEAGGMLGDDDHLPVGGAGLEAFGIEVTDPGAGVTTMEDVPLDSLDQKKDPFAGLATLDENEPAAPSEEPALEMVEVEAFDDFNDVIGAPTPAPPVVGGAWAAAIESTPRSSLAPIRDDNIDVTAQMPATTQAALVSRATMSDEGEPVMPPPSFPAKPLTQPPPLSRSSPGFTAPSLSPPPALTQPPPLSPAPALTQPPPLSPASTPGFGAPLTQPPASFAKPPPLSTSPPLTQPPPLSSSASPFASPPPFAPPPPLAQQQAPTTQPLVSMPAQPIPPPANPFATAGLAALPPPPASTSAPQTSPGFFPPPGTSKPQQTEPYLTLKGLKDLPPLPPPPGPFHAPPSTNPFGVAPKTAPPVAPPPAAQRTTDPFLPVWSTPPPEPKENPFAAPPALSAAVAVGSMLNNDASPSLPPAPAETETFFDDMAFSQAEEPGVRSEASMWTVPAQPEEDLPLVVGNDLPVIMGDRAPSPEPAPSPWVVGEPAKK